MKRIAFLSALFLVAACSPQIYPVYLEVRQPSSSGMDLNRKSMGIVFMDGAQPKDSTFDRTAASAFARQLEEDYFDGREEVELYHVPAADSVSLQLMHDLVMDTGKDVIFLLSSQVGDRTTEGALPVSSRLLVYDSMGEDRIRSYSGSALMPAAGKGEPSEAETAGNRMVRRFKSGWKTESFSFYYFDGFDDAWYDALGYVIDTKFSKAMDIWMPLTKDKSQTRRACAAYNMAMAFFLLEDYEMSRKLLELADKYEELTLSAGLHTRLSSKMNLEKR